MNIDDKKEWLQKYGFMNIYMRNNGTYVVEWSSEHTGYEVQAADRTKNSAMNELYFLVVELLYAECCGGS